MKELTLADLQEQMGRIQDQLGDAIRALTVATEKADRVTQLALARMGGHFTIDETAVAWGVSTKTIKRKINRGELQLEQIPETKVFGISADQVFGNWAPANLLRKSAAREKTR